MFPGYPQSTSKPEPEPEPEIPQGRSSVRDWRHEVAAQLGFDLPTSALLARRSDIDLHSLEALLVSGCDPTTALEIVL